jgi:hypothetical protein
VPVEWGSVDASLTLPCAVRRLVSRRRKSERRRGYTNVRNPVVRRKLLLGVVIKRS